MLSTGTSTGINENDEELYGATIHEDHAFMPPPDNRKLASVLEDSKVSLEAAKRVHDEHASGEGALNKRTRVHALMARNEDITMSGGENGGLGVFEGKWSDRCTSDSGVHRGAIRFGPQRVPGFCMHANGLCLGNRLVKVPSISHHVLGAQDHFGTRIT